MFRGLARPVVPSVLAWGIMRCHVQTLLRAGIALSASLWAGALSAAVIEPLPDDPSCTEADRVFMTRAYEMARIASARGDNPIGAALVVDGEIIFEYGNTVHTDSDVTMHGETGLISAASPVLDKSVWGKSTLYSSLEPCVMCCGSIRSVGIREVVWGGESRTSTGELHSPERLRPREIWERIGWEIEARGPLMDAENLEIRAAHRERLAAR